MAGNRKLLHTVEVTGSNPVAPTNRINHLQSIFVFSVAPERSNCSAMCLKSLCDRRSPIHPDRPIGRSRSTLAKSMGQERKRCIREMSSITVMPTLLKNPFATGS
jgi:hypothetical protein